jgi:type II secretory pathway component GspD/PulD (secretin)
MAQEAVQVIETEKPKEAAVAVTATPVTPATPAKALGVEVPITLTFDNTPLLDVVKAFRDTTGANLVTTGTNMNAVVISMRLDNVPWKQGLDSILMPQGLEAVEQPAGSGIYIIRNKSNDIPKFTKAFKLSFARAADIAQLFKTTFDLSMPAATGPAPVGAAINGTVSAYPSANTVIVTATQQQLDECEKVLAQIDVQRPQVYIEARFMELSASASRELGLRWNGLGGDGWGVGFDGASFGASHSRNRNNTRTSTRGRTGSATSTSSDHWDDAIRNIITDDSSSSEVNTGNTIANTFTELRDQTFTGSLSADKFRLAMNAFESLEDGAIFSNPRVIIANEEQATIDMTTKEPNVTIRSTRTGVNMDQLDITTELAVIPGKNELNVGEAFFSYGITLKVTPRVSPTGLITVVIEPAISSLLRYYEITDDKSVPLPKYPIIDVKRINTTFTMNDGYTAVIGGLTQTTEDSVDSGIPYLRRIPWIGEYLFGWKSRQKVQKEIIVFVTVGITEPATMKQDAGLPKNAVLGREYVTGARKEPGDRTKADMLNMTMKPVDKADKIDARTEEEIKKATENVTPNAPVPAP